MFWQDTDDEDEQVIRTYSTSSRYPNCSSHRRRQYLFQKTVLTKRMMGGGAATVWEDNSPDTLVDLAAQAVLKQPQTLFADYQDHTSPLRQALTFVLTLQLRWQLGKSGPLFVTEERKL